MLGKISIMVLRNKTNADRFLASSADVGDFLDENWDVTVNDIHNAYVIIRKDLSVPTVEDFEAHKTFHAKLKAHMVEKFGVDAFISLDFEEVCKHYEPTNIEINNEQYQQIMELMEE